MLRSRVGRRSTNNPPPQSEQTRGEKIAEAFEKERPKVERRQAAERARAEAPDTYGVGSTLTPSAPDTPGQAHCSSVARFHARTGSWIGSLVDSGPATYASGDVETDSSGTVVAYHVASGDTLQGIADRLCTWESSIQVAAGMEWAIIYAGERLDLVGSTPQPDVSYADAVVSYPRPLPEGYTFPERVRGLLHRLGADVADKWWWCSQIDAAWESYFNRDDEAAAPTHLRTAAEVDPGSFGTFEATGRIYPIDRDVRFIDGGVDSQYVEYTANGCWDWARSIGAKFVPMP